MSDKIYGLLGRKLGHSWSAPIHHALGCPDYRLIEIEPEDLASFLRREDIGGLNVTIPYKRDVIPLCDVVDGAAAAIGSVNTLVRRDDGRLYGYNTDIDGFLYMLRRADISLTGKKVVILGSGGASLTAQAAAKKLGARAVVVVSRTGPDNYGNLPERHIDAEVVVNATPVGMWPDVEKSPLDLRLLPIVTAAVDVIYNPARTTFLLQAEDLSRRAAWEAEQRQKEHGTFPLLAGRAMRYTGGLSMLVRQAVAAEELFFDKTIPDSETERILASLQGEMENLVLIGMPGCGKSTVGAALSKFTGKPLVDLDGAIVQRAGKHIPQIFAEEGEGAFRALEHQVLVEAASKTGQVIATGGGAVLWSENRLALRRSGRVCFLRRDLSLLPKDGRPLSQANDLQELYRARFPLYRDTADCVVDNDGSPEDAALLFLGKKK